MRWLYRPKHPNANANGLVDADLVYGDANYTGLYVISDEMEPTRHMADNQYFTSKSKFRENTRAHGCIEYGNEVRALTKPRNPVPLDRGKRRDDIRRAIYELRNGIRRGE